MATYDNLPPSKPAPRRAKNQPVFCVGWRAFVHWPAQAGQVGDPVPIVDDNGRPLSNDLVDGQEVEILSWKPKSREGSLYQIRRVIDDSEWWIGAMYLRPHSQPATHSPMTGVDPR